MFSKKSKTETGTGTDVVAKFAPHLVTSKSRYVYVLTSDSITFKGETYPLTGVTAKAKTSGGMTSYKSLVIEGPDFAFASAIDSVSELEAAKFAAAVNLAVRRAS
jgi:hypothetical protein